jgi:2,5-diketo-D-gluconate reductase A
MSLPSGLAGSPPERDLLMITPGTKSFASPTPTPPLITLNNGVQMPQLGFGLFKIEVAHAPQVISSALDAGYRHFDVASYYGNEAALGTALAQSRIPRDELFVTTKVWNTDQGFDATLAAFDVSQAALGLDVVDLYLIHWPAPALDRYVGTWLALERLYREGRVRAIGVSNFEPHHLERIIDGGGIVPAVNQVELHPHLQQTRLRALHTEFGIVTEGWSPLARGGLLGDPIITDISARHKVTPAQVVLRWHIQLGHVVCPKSATPSRIRENFDVFGFSLSTDDMQKLAVLDRNGRTGPHPDEFE